MITGITGSSTLDLGIITIGGGGGGEETTTEQATTVTGDFKNK